MLLAHKRNNFVRNFEQIWLRNLIRLSVAHININSDRNKTELLYDVVNLAFPTTYNLLQNIFEKLNKPNCKWQNNFCSYLLFVSYSTDIVYSIHVHICKKVLLSAFAILEMESEKKK